MATQTATAAGTHSAAMRPRRVHRTAALLALALLSLPLFARGGFATDSSQVQTAGGITAYLGVMPAAVIKGHPGRHIDRQAHGGTPAGRHEYHVLIALFDAKTGARIEDAKVTAQVSEIGLAAPRRALEPMRIADTVTYGNYFELASTGPYRIGVEVEHRQVVHWFAFAYEH